MPSLIKKFNNEEAQNIDMTFVEVIYPKTPQEYIYYLIIYYFRNNIPFRKCNYCEKYFIPQENLNIEYCERMIENSDKACREVGAVCLYQKKKFSDSIVKTYNRAYKRVFARIKYGMITKEQFANWSKEAREKRDEAINEKITEEDFEIWLDKVDKYYK